MRSRRRHERLGQAPWRQVAPKIYDQQAIVATSPQIAQDEGFRPDYGAVNSTEALRRKNRIVATEADEIAVQRDRGLVAFSLAPVQATFLEGL